MRGKGRTKLEKSIKVELSSACQSNKELGCSAKLILSLSLCLFSLKNNHNFFAVREARSEKREACWQKRLSVVSRVSSADSAARTKINKV